MNRAPNSYVSFALGHCCEVVVVDMGLAIAFSLSVILKNILSARVQSDPIFLHFCINLTVPRKFKPAFFSVDQSNHEAPIFHTFYLSEK